MNSFGEKPQQLKSTGQPTRISQPYTKLLLSSIIFAMMTSNTTDKSLLLQRSELQVIQQYKGNFQDTEAQQGDVWTQVQLQGCCLSSPAVTSPGKSGLAKVASVFLQKAISLRYLKDIARTTLIHFILCQFTELFCGKQISHTKALSVVLNWTTAKTPSRATRPTSATRNLQLFILAPSSVQLTFCVVFSVKIDSENDLLIVIMTSYQ